MKKQASFWLAAVLLCGARSQAVAQCHSSSTNGGSTSVINTAGFALAGTALSGASSLDGLYYQSTSILGIGPNPTVRTMFSTAVENGYNLGGAPAPGRGGGPIYYGGVFSNPTGAAISLTQVSIASSGDTFFDISGTTTPAAGWTVTKTLLRWTGVLSVPANSAQEFIVPARPLYFATANIAVTLTFSVVAGGTTYTAPGFAQTLVGGSGPYGADAVGGFDTVGGATYAPDPSIAVGAPGTATNFSVRVRESGNNGSALNGIDSHTAAPTSLVLRVTIPAGWSAVSVTTATTPWQAPGTATIVQPTATVDGSVSITTTNGGTGQIDTGTSSPAGSLVIRATSPAGTYSSSLFPFTFTLTGTSQGTGASQAPIASINQSVVRVTSASVAGVNTEYLSAVLSSAVRQIDLRADFNVTLGSGSDVVNFDVFNFVTASWVSIGSATPTAANSTLTRTFTSDFAPYVSGNRMRVRLVSTGANSRIVGVDQLLWTVSVGYTVNNTAGVGNDANTGSIASPFATIGRGTSALPALGGSGAVYVEVGASQSGSPYAVNPIVTGASSAGTALCSALYQGVINGLSQRPLVRGANPAADAGFDIQANYVTVDSFEIANSLVGLYSEPATVGAIFSNNLVHVPDLAYGMILDTTSSSLVFGNRVDATGTGSFFGIWDYTGTGNTIDSNKVTGQATDGIRSDYSNGLTVRRNVSAGNRIGIDIAHSSGAVNLYNNTADGSSYLGFYAESPSGTVTSRNNIITGSGVAGWGWNGVGTIDSNYDDVFGNLSNYVFHGTVVAGANSISASPSFVQTNNPALATYYKLNVGSPCIDRGVNVGLPFLGAAPDIGGVESQ